MVMFWLERPIGLTGLAESAEGLSVELSAAAGSIDKADGAGAAVEELAAGNELIPVPMVLLVPPA